MEDKEKLYDVVVVGGGPAGLSAAIYLTRARYRVLVLEREQFGGQITITNEVVNYPGVGKCSGKDLTHTMYQQAEYFGADFLIANATGFELEDTVKTVHTDRGDFFCLGILLATGAHPRMVGFSGEKEYRGRGVAYCATCDGEFFTGKEVFVVGGGFAAAEESVFLTKFASHVTILVRGDDFTCAKTAAEQARNHPKITVLTNTEIEEVKGDGGITYIRCKNNRTGEIKEYSAKEQDNFGVFVFVGYEPETELVKGIAKLDERGYILTDSAQRTSVEGLYAAGDICVKPLRQVVTAASDGALAATELEKYVAKVQQSTGIHPQAPVMRENQVKNPAADSAVKSEDGLFTVEMRTQLENVFDRMEDALVLKLYPDDRPVSEELKAYVTELTKMTDKLTMELVSDKKEAYAPCVKLYRKEAYTGLAFHGVPGGHEFTSFVLGIYNAAGPGQPVSEEIKEKIRRIKHKTDIKILVSLSCTMCPDLVVAAQQLASLGTDITAEVYDIAHFKELKDKYNVMSVPCMVLNDESVYFGKKNIQELLEILEKNNY